MDVKKFLRKIRSEQTELELLLLKRDNIVVIHGMTYDKDKVQISASGDNLSEIAIKNAELLNAIDKKIKQYNENQQKALDLIFSLEDDAQRQVLMMYYMTRKSQENSRLTTPYSLAEVADFLNMSFDYVRHVHGDALNALRKNKKEKASA